MQRRPTFPGDFQMDPSAFSQFGTEAFFESVREACDWLAGLALVARG